MYKIELDPFYEMELEQILIGIISDYTTEYALKIVIMIDEYLERLKDFPKIYAVYADVPIYRKIVIDKKYTIFYIIDENEKIVRLMHIFRPFVIYQVY